MVEVEPSTGRCEPRGTTSLRARDPLDQEIPQKAHVLQPPHVTPGRAKRRIDIAITPLCLCGVTAFVGVMGGLGG